MNIIKNIKDRFKKRCFDFVICHYKKIPFEKVAKASFALSNSSCHHNAVAAVNSGRADIVIMVWAGKSDGCIHFINRKGNEYFDETWHDYKDQNYYIIRIIEEPEYEYIVDLLNASKRMMFSVNGTFLSRYFGMNKIHDWI